MNIELYTTPFSTLLNCRDIRFPRLYSWLFYLSAGGKDLYMNCKNFNFVNIKDSEDMNKASYLCGLFNSLSHETWLIKNISTDEVCVPIQSYADKGFLRELYGEKVMDILLYTYRMTLGKGKR